ncbi:MAG: hypothetical protein C4583_06465 [Anaerolineaceae bacterium]|nr:MAG: hypothetical protein C4583_06465 [Anaerolineaceae bacterium]
MELKQETGFIIEEGSFLQMGIIHPNSGLFQTSANLFLAQCDRPIAVIQRDNETKEFRWFSIEHVLKMIEEGSISDGYTMSAILRAKLKGKLFF